MPTDPNAILPPANPPGTGLANTTPQPALPAPLPVTPVAPTPAVSGTAGQANATGYNPTPYAVPSEGLVQQQVKKIVEGDSDLLKMARSQATQDMAARGLVNSTLNTQAGENAVIAQSLPIAQQDAASIRDAAFKTSEAQNVASQFGAAAQNTVSQTNAQLETSMNTTNANAQNNALSASALAANTRNLAAIDNNNKQALAVLSQQNSQLLQTNTNAANMFQETVKNIAAISMNDTMNQTAKDAAISSQLNLLSQGLLSAQSIGGTVPSEVGNLNLGEFFQTTTGSASFTPAQRVQQLANLTSQLTNAQRNLADARSGRTVPVLTGPNASERRVPIWNQAISDANAAVQNIQAQINALKAANTP